MRNLAATLTLTTILLAPASALAYVGPGAGLGLLGALWGLLAALGVALMFILAWPVRRLLRSRRPAAVQERSDDLRVAGAPGGRHPQQD